VCPACRGSLVGSPGDICRIGYAASLTNSKCRTPVRTDELRPSAPRRKSVRSTRSGFHDSFVVNHLIRGARIEGTYRRGSAIRKCPPRSATIRHGRGSAGLFAGDVRAHAQDSGERRSRSDGARAIRRRSGRAIGAVKSNRQCRLNPCCRVVIFTRRKNRSEIQLFSYHKTAQGSLYSDRKAAANAFQYSLNETS
jgi:hypothetical protein